MTLPPLVLLHGFLGAPSSFAELRRGLRYRGRILAPWLPGHGPDPTTVGSFSEGVHVIAETLRAPSFVLGYSMGGRLALGLAALHPERVLGVIAVGAHLGLSDASERASRVAWERAEAERLKEQGLEHFVRHWERLDLLSTQTPEQIAAQRAVRLSHDARALADALLALGTGSMPDLRAALNRTPVLLVTGARDAKFSALAAPHGSTCQVPGAGHNVVLEAPRTLAEIVDRELSKWLSPAPMETSP